MQSKKTIYICILDRENGLKKYIVINNINQLREISQKFKCKVEICEINDIHGYYETTSDI